MGCCSLCILHTAPCRVSPTSAFASQVLALVGDTCHLTSHGNSPTYRYRAILPPCFSAWSLLIFIPCWKSFADYPLIRNLCVLELNGLVRTTRDGPDCEVRIRFMCNYSVVIRISLSKLSEVSSSMRYYCLRQILLRTYLDRASPPTHIPAWFAKVKLRAAFRTCSLRIKSYR